MRSKGRCQLKLFATWTDASGIKQRQEIMKYEEVNTLRIPEQSWSHVWTHTDEYERNSGKCRQLGAITPMLLETRLGNMLESDQHD